MFGFDTFSEAPFSTLPATGVVYSASVAETVAAATAVAALSVFAASFSDTVAAAEQVSSIGTFSAISAESASGSDAVAVAASIFSAASSEAAVAQDSVNAPGSVYNPTVSETATTAETVQATSTIPSSVAEAATVADSAASAFTAEASVAESATASEIASALAAFAALAAESASAADSTLVAPSVFSAIAVASAQALDSLNAPGSIYNATLSESVTVLDSIIGAFLWNLIDDTQGTGWITISTLPGLGLGQSSVVTTPSVVVMPVVSTQGGYLQITTSGTGVAAWSSGGFYTCSAQANGYAYVFNYFDNTYAPLRSVDGLTWEIVNRPLTNRPLLAVFGNGVQLVVVQNGRSYVSTDNGATWTAGAAGLVNSVYGEAVWDGVRYNLVLGRRRYTSTDGLNWATGTSDSLGYDHGFIAWNGSVYVSLNTSNVPAFQSVVRISTDGVTFNVVTPITASTTAAVLGLVNNEFVFINTAGTVLKLDTVTNTFITVGQVPDSTFPRDGTTIFRFAQAQGKVFIPGVRTTGFGRTYLTTTDFVTYTVNDVFGWIGVDDTQNPNWQNISNV